MSALARTIQYENVVDNIDGITVRKRERMSVRKGERMKTSKRERRAGGTA